MIEKTEAQIMENWENDTPPLVSVICITYNQEQYIADAIEGFLQQETNFSFEIIIHEDASTDRTADIVFNYSKKYPNIIKPIFQKENQLVQKGVNVQLTAALYSKGKYLACCEGDDYWIDPKKLQIQIEEMQKNPQCDISFHPGIYKWADGSQKDKTITQYSSQNKIFTISEIILGGGGFCLSPTLVIKRTIFESLPSWYHQVPAGDYFLQMLGSIKGGALYVNRVMAVYRTGIAGSWSDKISSNPDYFYYFYTSLLKAIENMNLHTHYQYTSDFKQAKRNISIYMYRSLILSSQKRKKAFLENKALLNRKDIIMWYLLYKNKLICSLLRKIKNYILGLNLLAGKENHASG